MPSFFRTAREKGLKPIVGAEMTLQGGLPHHPARKGSERIRQPLPPDHKGPAFRLEGRPPSLLCPSRRIERRPHLSLGMQKGEIPSALLQGRREDAEKAVLKYRSVFPPGASSLELQHHLDPEDTKLCRQLVELAGRPAVLPVVTNNVHYRQRQDYRLHDVLTCIRNRVSLDESAPFRRPNSEYFLKRARRDSSFWPACRIGRSGRPSP